MSDTSTPSSVSPVAKKWLRIILGAGVSVPIALMPLIGKLGIPPFQGLLNLIPESIQPVVIPLSCAAMALTAVSVEFRVLKTSKKKTLLAEARRGVLITAVLLAAFAVAYAFLVTKVNLMGGEQSATFVTGLGDTSKPPCVGLDVEGCIKYLTLEESAITSYFGDRQIRVSRLVLETLYIGFFAAFGNLAGILVSLQTNSQTAPRRRRPSKPTATNSDSVSE